MTSRGYRGPRGLVAVATKLTTGGERTPDRAVAVEKSTTSRRCRRRKTRLSPAAEAPAARPRPSELDSEVPTARGVSNTSLFIAKSATTVTSSKMRSIMMVANLATAARRP